MSSELIANVDFKDLPQILQTNKALTDRALKAINTKIQTLPDTAGLDVTAGDKLELEINDLRRRGDDALKINKERRMVLTKKMDEIKKAFTEDEALYAEPLSTLKGWCDEWAREKFNRAAEIERKAEEKVAKDNARIDFSRHIAEQIHSTYYEMKVEFIQRMNDAFNNKTLDQIDQYGDTLKAWEPKFELKGFGWNKPKYLNDEEINEVLTNTKKSTYELLTPMWISEMNEEKERLIELIPSRKMELERISKDANEAKKAAERIAKETKERKELAEKEEKEMLQAAAAAADNAKLINILENSMAEQAITATKGTQHKKKYAPKNHTELIGIIQWWVAKEMHLLTIDELTKKFSFMLTAANKDLNKGIAIEGVPVVDDFSTRTSKPK